MIKKTKLAFVGLTHLGLNYLAASASKKYSVLGIDLNKNKIKKLNDNIIEYREPNLKKTILKNKKNIYFSNDFKKLKQCDLVFISEDVKTDLKAGTISFQFADTFSHNSVSIFVIVTEDDSNKLIDTFATSALS